MNDWHPIELAPLNRRILLYYPPKTEERRGFIICGSWYTDEKSKNPEPYFTNDNAIVRGTMHTKYNQPTLWMELPDEPD